MISKFKKIYFQLQIKWLVIFKPTALFAKINQLNWYKNTLYQWVDDLHFNPKSKVLEAGCASGVLTSHIAKLNHTPTGIDLSNNMVKLAKRKNNYIDFSVADIFDLPFKADLFDSIITASLLNIVPNQRKAIDELSRVCKKGGIIAVLVPLGGFNDNNLLALQASLGNTGFSFAAMNAWHKLAPKMKASDISAFFKQAGLTEIIIRNYLQGMVVSVSAVKPL